MSAMTTEQSRALYLAIAGANPDEVEALLRDKASPARPSPIELEALSDSALTFKHAAGEDAAPRFDRILSLLRAQGEACSP